MIPEHDVSGQVVVLAAKPVGDPRAYRGTAWELIARERMVDRRAVIVVVDLDAVDEREVVHVTGQIRQEL